MEENKLNNRQKGSLGEDVACTFLLKKGFTIGSRNFLKKWGELDIVAEKIIKKEKSVHFIEVKSVTRKFTKNGSLYIRPEENVHVLKQRRLRRTIQTYFIEKKIGPDVPFYFHICVVYMDMSSRLAHVEFIENVII